MRFHFVAGFTTTAFRRRLSAPHTQQRREYAPLRQLTRKPSVSETPKSDRIPPQFSALRRFYSSKSSSSSEGFPSWFVRMLESRPILTKSLSADIISQALALPHVGFLNFGVSLMENDDSSVTLEFDSNWDPKRTLFMTVNGQVVLGPAQHVWFNLVGRVLPNCNFLATVIKIGTAHVVFMPALNAIWNRFKPEEKDGIEGRVRRDPIPSSMSLYWLICEFLIYGAVLVPLQPVMHSSCLFLWNLSFASVAITMKPKGLPS